jgi:transcriptional regulator with XRE-family HTH domain
MSQPTHFGEMLRLYRTVENFTLRDMGSDIGISAATLLRIEQGKAFDTATLMKLLTWLLKHEK